MSILFSAGFSETPLVLTLQVIWCLVMLRYLLKWLLEPEGE